MIRIQFAAFSVGNDQREPLRQDFDFHGQEAARIAVQLIGYFGVRGDAEPADPPPGEVGQPVMRAGHDRRGVVQPVPQAAMAEGANVQ